MSLVSAAGVKANFQDDGIEISIVFYIFIAWRKNFWGILCTTRVTNDRNQSILGILEYFFKE